MIGLVHWMTFDGGMTHDIFGNFLIKVSEMLQYNAEPYILLRDNVTSHLNSVNFEDQGEIMYLTKYSPFLNMAEMAGSCVKASLKRVMATPGVQKVIYDRGDGGRPRDVEMLHNQRIRIVKREFENAIPTITVNKCEAFMRHVLSYIPRFMNVR